MNPKLGLTRNIQRSNYALITPDGYVASVFPGWTDCTPHVLISAALGAGLSQYLVQFNRQTKGSGETAGDVWFLYVVAGQVRVNGKALSTGGFAYLPAQTAYAIRGGSAAGQLLVFRKKFEPLAGQKAPGF
ncbi:MAG TPA: (S)-ureidoglycine aminohydrolase, partial [Verrucomicrobiae bacterium]